MKKDIVIKVFLLNILMCIFVSCSMNYKSFRKSTPKDIGLSNNEVLICLLEEKFYDNVLITQVENEYNGRYIFLRKEDLKSEVYNDSLKYKYLLSRIQPFKTSGFLTIFSYGLEDRMNGEKYLTKHVTSDYTKLLKSYLQSLEKTRIRNTKRYKRKKKM